MTSAFVKYVDYLREMARRIALQSDVFLNVTSGSRSKSDFFYKLDTRPLQSSVTQVAREFNNKSRSGDLSLFLGIGLVQGSVVATSGTRRRLAAPLVLVPIEVLSDESDVGVDLSEEWGKAALNYELISVLSTEGKDSEDEDQDALDALLRSSRVPDAVSRVETLLQASAIELEQDPHSVTEQIHTILFDSIPGYSRIVQRNARPQLLIDRQVSTNGATLAHGKFLFAAKTPSSLTASHALGQIVKSLAKDPSARSSSVVATLIDSALAGNATTFPTLSEDFARPVSEAIEMVPMPLSQRQRDAIAMAWRSPASFIQGPPGTGKSHVITALMATSLLLGKSCLLVSHKKAAIDIVESMLSKFIGGRITIRASGDVDSRAKARETIDELLARTTSWFGGKPELAAEEVALTRRLWSAVSKRVDALRDLSSYLDATNEHSDALERLQKLQREHQVTFGANDADDEHVGGIEPKSKSDREWLERILSRKRESSGVTRLSALQLRIKSTRLSRVWDQAWMNRWPIESQRLMSLLEVVTQRDRSIGANRAITRRSPDYPSQLRGEVERWNSEVDAISKELILCRHRLREMEAAAAARDDLRGLRSAYRFRRPARVEEALGSVDFSRITKVFPLWLGELRHLGTVLPAESGLFDMVIIDEASQANIAESIPALNRGGRAVVVGDTKQLSIDAAGITMKFSGAFERMIWNSKYQSEALGGRMSYEGAKERSLLVSKSSILDMIVSDSHSLDVPKVTLDEHFRSIPRLAHFTSKAFYSEEGGLKVMTEIPENLERECFEFIEVGGSREIDQKVMLSEVSKAIELVQGVASGGLLVGERPLARLGYTKSRRPTLGIVSILGDQVAVLREKIDLVVSEEDQKSLDIFIGTPEEFQGNERDVIILTLGLGEGKTRYAKGHYENRGRFNVATSRAKKFTFVIAGRIPDNSGLLASYLKHFGKLPDRLMQLGDDLGIAVPTSTNRMTWRLDPDKCESEFERRVLESLEEYRQSRQRECRVRLSLYNQVETCGQKRLDFVVVNDSNGKDVAVEADGPSHFVYRSRKYSEVHVERANVLKRAGWKIVNVPMYLWYQNGWLMDRRNDDFAHVQRHFWSQLDKILAVQVPQVTH